MGAGAPIKTPTPNHTDTNQLMTANLAISLLRRGSNGDEILQILESIAADNSNDSQPTAEPIQF
jgi:hypothetical protein